MQQTRYQQLDLIANLLRLSLYQNQLTKLDTTLHALLSAC